MTYRKIAVFSASARPGLAQVRALADAGYDVRVISRRDNPAFAAHEQVRADLNDPASLARACEGVDAIFYTSPTFSERDKLTAFATSMVTAAREAGVRRIVYNSTSWHPGRLTGVPTMDEQVNRNAALAAGGVPLTTVRPSLFMDNLLTAWVKPELLRTGVFAYPHREDLEVRWICLDDVARVMIATLADERWADQTLDVGGPELLTPPEVCARLSEVLGRPIAYRRITPREFGERMYDVFKTVVGQSRETYVHALEQHYLFKNAQNPFAIPKPETTDALGVRMTPMREWLARQDWSETRAAVGSVSG